MVRTEISLFLKNIPGELGRLASLFSNDNINIDALTIQDGGSPSSASPRLPATIP